jgi:CheY-like chemotaxis protein
MKYSILVVEDNRTNRELLGDWLDVEGHHVLFAEDLQQAFAILNVSKPDAVLLDVQLGVEDGLDLAKWIRQEPKLSYVPVIAVTAHAMVTDQQRVIQAGCNACVSKPIDFQLLRQHLTQWLDHTVTFKQS